MNVILIYDSPNSNQFNKICKKYLNWIQNSCFEGEITETNLMKLKKEIKDISENEDSVIIFQNTGGYNKYIIGKEKNTINNIL